MAAGTAIVATDTPCATHLLCEGVSALLAPKGDPRRCAAAMLKFCDSPDLRRQLGAAAKAHVDTRPQRVRQALERIYAARL
jgi:glycosyltransferase involved in cell wall biosynthesis